MKTAIEKSKHSTLVGMSWHIGRCKELWIVMTGQMESELQGIRQTLSVSEAERDASREQVHLLGPFSQPHERNLGIC